jgi:glycosyltransferase involved in cell wall biosynthesis
MGHQDKSKNIQSDQRVRILFLIQKLIAGGCERQIIEVMDGIDHTRYEPILGCLERGGIYTKLVESKGIPIVYFERNYRWDLGPIFKIAKYAKRNNITFLHSFLALPGFYATVAGKLARITTITSSIAGPTQRASTLLIKLSKYSDMMLPNTQAGLKHFFPGKIPKNCIVIPTGVDTRRLNPPMDRAAKLTSLGMNHFKYIVGWVAGLKETKDPISFLKAAQIVLEKRDDIGFIIVGNGPLRNQVLEYIAENNLSKNVFSLIDRNDVEELFKIFDIFILASSPIHGEGIPLAVAEAMTSYCPVIATDSGAIKEIVRENENGFVVSTENHIAIAEKINCLLDNEEMRKQFSKRSREIIDKEFAMPIIARKIETVYEQFLNDQGATK